MSKTGRAFAVEERLHHVSAQLLSGLTIAEYCQHNKLSPSTFHYWKWKMKNKSISSVTSSFIEIPIPFSRSIEICCGNFSITVPQSFDPSHLTEILSSVSRAVS